MTYDIAGLVLGRILLGGFFIMNGLNHFMKKEMLVGYAESKGVPSANLMVPLTGAMLLVGGLSVLLWAYVPVGVLLISLFLLTSSFQMHNFWAIEDAEQKQQEMTQFMKNMAILGGTLFLLSINTSTYTLQSLL